MTIHEQGDARLRVLRTVRKLGPISRIELARETGLSPAHVTSLTADLIDRKLLVQSREERQGRGRPREPLQIDAHSLIVVAAGIDARGDLRAGFVNLAGQLLEEHQSELPPANSVNEMAQAIAMLLNDIIRRSGRELTRIGHIGLSLPATVDIRSGEIRWVPTLAGSSAPLASEITALTGISATIENDVECLARARFWYSPGVPPENFTIVHVGMNLGSASYVEGKARIGANGINAEFGHVKTDFSSGARLCFCGGQGCLTTYASIGGILVSANGDAVKTASDVDEISAQFERLMDQVSKGNDARVPAFEIAGRHLGNALANHINMFDPGLVILQTSHATMLDLMWPALRRTLARNTLPALMDRTQIVIEPLNDLWRWQGVAALSLEQFYRADPPPTT